MKSLFLSVAVVLLWASTSQAYWALHYVDRWVQQTNNVQVMPAPVMAICSLGYGHLTQPAPYWQQQTQWVLQRTPEYYWVQEVIYPSYPSVYPSSPCYSGGYGSIVYPVW